MTLRPTRVRDLQGGHLVEFEGRTWVITRLLWAPNGKRDVTMELWPVRPSQGNTIERTFFNSSELPSGPVPRREPVIPDRI